MPLYLAELYRASAGSGDLAEGGAPAPAGPPPTLPQRGCGAAAGPGAPASAMTRAGTRVRYVRSVFIPADETWFLLYDASTAADVLEAAGKAGIRLERVVEAIETEPSRRPGSGCS